MPINPDFIWIEDAAKEYGRSRRWLDQQVKAGQLSYAFIPGDRQLYLLRSELDKLFNPPIQRKEQDTQDAG